jgi:hypothetical protein
MTVQANTTFGQQSTDHLLESTVNDFGLPEVRKWKIIGPNRFQSNGWNIKYGLCTRVVFPIDLDHYYLN